MRAAEQLRFDVDRPARGCLYWRESHKYDRVGARLADRHYSRRKVGSPQFMPPGETIVLVAPGAVWGWWRPHPRSGIKAANGFDGWTCSIFRRESGPRASDLVLDAERALAAIATDCGPDGMLSYVKPRAIRSTNPGYCFKCAGWIEHPTRPRSTKGLVLLWKPFDRAGVLR